MKQLTIVTEIRDGVLAQVTDALAAREINIEDIEVETESGRGVIVLSVEEPRYDEALRALRQAGFQTITQDALVVRLEDKPGALAELAARFQAAEVGLRSMHLIQRRAGHAHVSIVTTDNLRAAHLLADLL